MSEKEILRKQLRKQRQVLNDTQQQIHAFALLNQIISFNIISKNLHIAIYIAHDGEINTQPLIEYLWKEQCHCYLPCLTDQSYLLFQPYRPNDSLMLNRYLIQEPINQLPYVSMSELDIVFIPLVAFDLNGHRLGRGKGYYDKTIAHLNNMKSRPKLIGLAHDFQKIKAVPVDKWDQPLDFVITEKASYETRIKS